MSTPKHVRLSGESTRSTELLGTLPVVAVTVVGVAARITGHSSLPIETLLVLNAWFLLVHHRRVQRLLSGRSGRGFVALRTGVSVLTWAVPVAYLTGWGPALYGLCAVIGLWHVRTAGSVAARWTGFWSALGLAAAQWATLAGHLPARLPDSVSTPLSIGSAVLLGLLLLEAGRLSRAVERVAAEMAATEQYFRTISLDSSTLLCVVDARYRLVHVSASVERITGRRVGELIGRSPETFVSRTDAGAFSDLCARLKQTHGEVCRSEYRIVQADGSSRWYEVLGRNLLDDRRVGGIVLDHRDITERREYQQRLVHDANHDGLTGLANRAYLWRELDALFATTQPVGMLFVDLDGFKPINDTLGHHAGDEVLVRVADVLRASVRGEDVVARLGGDEFAVLLRDVTRIEDVEAAARTVKAHFAAPWVVAGRSVRVGASIGTSLRNYNCLTAAELMSRADTAMYEDKNADGPSGRRSSDQAPSV